MLPAKETELTNIHFRLDVVAETGCGISRGELPVNLATTRHSLLLSHTAKGQKAGSLASQTDKRVKKLHAHQVLPSELVVVAAHAALLCYGIGGIGFPRKCISLTRGEVDLQLAGCAKFPLNLRKSFHEANLSHPFSL